MRSIELAIYCDDLCADAAAVAARAERVRSRLRSAAIEREARRTLSSAVVAALEALGVFGVHDERALREELRELEAAQSALAELQAWVEEQLEVSAA